MKTETSTKKVIRGVISAVLSFVLSLSLVLLGMVPALDALASEETWVRVAEDGGYAETLRERLLEKYEFLGQTSGVPASVYRAFLEEELTSSEALLPLLGMFSEETNTVDRDAMTEAFCQRVEEYALSLQLSGELVLSEEEWAEMKADFPTLAEYYIDELVSAVNMSGVFTVMGSALRILKKLILPILLCGAVFGVFSLGLLILIRKKKILYFGYLTLLSSGILLMAPALWLKIGDYAAKLAIEPSYLKELLVALTDIFSEKLLLVGGIFAALGVILGVLAIFAQKNKPCDLGKEKENDPKLSKPNA